MNNHKTIGYTCGSFDLFHIGHLNILKRAKENCDYLIVGLNSDETMLRCKNKLPVIPFNERKQILEAIRYVDKVIKVECLKPNSKADDWDTRLKADIVIASDECINHPEWQELAKLKQNSNSGKILFFPYTKTTSSTLIRKLLQDKLIDN